MAKYIPESPDIYQGKQVIINSDRLLFNAKNDSILLFSDKAIGFSTNGSVHFDTSEDKESKFVVNSPSMYLGLNPDNSLAAEPALLGEQTDRWLNELLDMVAGLIDDLCLKFTLIGLAPGAPTAPNPANKGALALRNLQIEKLRAKLDLIKSTKIFLAEEGVKIGNFIERDLRKQDFTEPSPPTNLTQGDLDADNLELVDLEDEIEEEEEIIIEDIENPPPPEELSTDINADDLELTDLEDDEIEEEEEEVIETFEDKLKEARDANQEEFEYEGTTYQTNIKAESEQAKIDALVGAGEQYLGLASSIDINIARQKARIDAEKDLLTYAGVTPGTSVNLAGFVLVDEDVVSITEGGQERFEVFLIYELREI